MAHPPGDRARKIHGRAHTPRPVISLATTLSAAVERYIAAHSCCDDYAQRANRWLGSLLAAGLAPDTVDGYRRALLAVWRDLYDRGETDEPPLRVRRIKRRAAVVEAFRRDQLLSLIDAAGKMAGSYRWGVEKSAFWVAAIRAAYDSGLRRGDLLIAEIEHVSPSGAFSVVQHKTGHIHRGRLSRATLDALAAVTRADGRWLPWDIGLNYFGQHFCRIRNAAGIDRGTFKWVRRASGSYAERETPGAGAKVLGHRDGRVFRRHYEDRSITDAVPLSPPEL